jgi:hypothetical protein
MIDTVALKISRGRLLAWLGLRSLTYAAIDGPYRLNTAEMCSTGLTGGVRRIVSIKMAIEALRSCGEA